MEILPLPTGFSGGWFCGGDGGAAGDSLVGVDVVLGGVGCR
jgi:hypothetical protein